MVTSGTLWALRFGVGSNGWAERSPPDPRQLHHHRNSKCFSWSSILRAVDWPKIASISLNSEKGGKEMSSHDLFFHTRKKALRQGVDSHPHFPLTEDFTTLGGSGGCGQSPLDGLRPGKWSQNLHRSTRGDSDLSLRGGP